MIRPETAMILAAGFGTRMGTLTRDRPKPMLPLDGRPMIDRALAHAGAAGVRHAVVNLHYLGDQIRTHLMGRQLPRVTFSEEQPDILDTGGGIVQALPQLGTAPFHVLNSDAVWIGPNPLDILCQTWDPDRMDSLLLLVPRSASHAYTRPGDFFLDRDGARPERRGDAPTAPLVYTGAHITRPEAFADAPDGAFSLNLLWNRQAALGRLAATTYPGAWVDVGTPEGLQTAETLIRQERE